MIYYNCFDNLCLRCMQEMFVLGDCSLRSHRYASLIFTSLHSSDNQLENFRSFFVYLHYIIIAQELFRIAVFILLCFYFVFFKPTPQSVKKYLVYGND